MDTMQATPKPVRPLSNSHLDDPGLDTRAFRDALGAFVTGVTIVTTLDREGRPSGLTANSFNSVSLDPPMVLWSLALDSTNLQAFRHADWWAVHVLAAGQEDLSNRFARRDADKFEGVPTSPGPGGIPLLAGSAARFICRAAFEYEGGDHAIFLGAVQNFEQSGEPPLVYHQGRYGGVLPKGAAAAGDEGPAALDELERLGFATRRDGAAKLTEAGRNVAGGLVSLAKEGAMSAYEVAALRHLLALLS